jgi:hypothetical protein
VRDPDTIETAIRTVMARRANKINARDRRENDMLSALRDVETYTRQIANDDHTIEDLFAELDRARLAAEIPA